MNLLDTVTFSAAVFFACAFLFGKHLRTPQHHLVKRAFVSLGSGVSVAYVFLHVLPILEKMRRAVEAIPDMPHPFHGLLVYVAAMLGFLLFYGVDRGMRRKQSVSEAGYFAIFHLSGFGLYVWLVSYFLVRGPEREPWAIGLYTAAMLLHFITMNYNLRHQYGVGYDHRPSKFLAMCTLAGWLCGRLFEMPILVLVFLVSLVAGAIIVNTMITELAGDDEGLFIPFSGGALLFSYLLIMTH